jgi:serine/threonine-protein kinase HipA
MKRRELSALVWGLEAGRVRQDGRGRLGFAYLERWREGAESVPLSLSMPLAAREHGHDAIDAYLRGLLPDNEFVLERWASRFQVSSRNPFALVAAVGEECPGAVQFAVPDRAAGLRGQGGLEVRWIEEEEVADRLRALRGDGSAWRLAEDPGQFSLAGAQPKTTLLRLDGRWGIPFGRTPTTHILKPPAVGLDGHVENEHLCLLLARESGLATASSEVRRFGDEIAIVVERYDRALTAGLADAAAAEAAAHAARSPSVAADAPRGAAAAKRAAATVATTAEASARSQALRTLAATQPVLRLHQEDLCQALAVRPTFKYQNEGGPSPARVVRLLREHSGSPDEDIRAFLDALVFNWLIGGTDAHAKNYSILHGREGRVRLAPLYDLASALPYPSMNPPRVKLAMRIGSEYWLHRIRARHWTALAKELELDPGRVLRRMVDFSNSVAAAIPKVRAQAIGAGLVHPIVARLLDLVANRVEECLRELDPPTVVPFRDEEGP